VRADAASVADIARACGWRSPSRVVAAFRRAYGITPVRWRLVNRPA